VADLSMSIDRAAIGRVAAHVDREGKLPRTLEALGPVADRDVVVVDADLGLLAQRLSEIGARVTALVRPDGSAAGDLRAALAADASPVPAIRVEEGSADRLGLPDGAADVIVAGFSAYRGVDAAEIAEADRVLRRGGRLLVVHDYGRDDIADLEPADRPEYVSWSRRDGPFLRGGFKVRVVHCWWTFDELVEAAEVLGLAFGPAGRDLAARLRRPRLSYNVAVYHRSRRDG
jgi:SAM-dependent methyltransferase